MHPRFAVPAMHVPVTIRRITSMTLQRLDGHVYDLSRGGMRFEIDQPLSVDEHIHFALDLPCGEGSVAGTARVVRVHDELDDPGPRRMAVQFISFDDETNLSRLEHYLEQRQLRKAA